MHAPRTHHGRMSQTIDPRAKQQLEQDNLEALNQDLWEGRTVFRSGPRTVELQLSNFCNMSCTMCYNGDNPPTVKIAPHLLRKLEQDVLPRASVLMPFRGSEPLIVTWDQARELARSHGLELELITNLQFLDEKKFHELEPFVSSIIFSIDSHIEEVYERIRLRSRPRKVFHNLPVATRLCREHGIEVCVNAVFLTENARTLPDSIAAFADAGVHACRILRYVELVPGQADLCAFKALSRAEIEDLKQRMRDVARQKRIRLILDLDEFEYHDHLPDEVGRTLRSRRRDDYWLERLRRFYPGYCRQSVQHLRVDASGEAFPCCFATAGDLLLGNLNQQSVAEVWNGPMAQALRRGMLTWDVPEICQNCTTFHSDRLGEQDHMPFADLVAEEYLAGHRGRLQPLPVEGPGHLQRLDAAPEFRWQVPAGHEPDRFVLSCAAGGEQGSHEHRAVLEAGARRYRIPDADWQQLRGNVAYWWAIWAVCDQAPAASLRSAKIPCFIRHQDL